MLERDEGCRVAVETLEFALGEKLPYRERLVRGS
jgi:hypothetical protein